MELVPSADLQVVARETRERVAARLHALGVPGDLELTGAASVPGLLTRGDVDLHLRVPAPLVTEAVLRLRAAYPVASPAAWAPTLAVFDVPGPRSTGVAATPRGSEHDVRFVTGWRLLRARPDLRAAYDELRRSAGDAGEYERRKAAFFTGLVASPARASRQAGTGVR